MIRRRSLSLFAVTAPGLEALADTELRGMGIVGTPGAGGVLWTGDVAEMYRANLRLRTASRILVRIAEFRARTFFELERHARNVEWDQFVEPGAAVRFRVTSSKSKLYHEGAIEERLRAAVEHRIGALRAPAESAAGAADASSARDEDEDRPAQGQLFVVRFHRDGCTLSADSSGDLLHRRGYREAIAKAPLRETLAAAALVASGWRADAPLLDCFCGSGTIPIEAALIARRIAPGLANDRLEPRDFGFLRWPGADHDLWDATVRDARSRVLPEPAAPIHASDRDAGAVAAAAQNAARAGVLDSLRIETSALSAVQPPAGTGWLVSNPPYGVRVGDTPALRNLYASLGGFARARLPGWTLALLTADRPLERQVGIEFRDAIRTRNGGIPVHLVVGRVPPS
jgi:putative N6-adenine-specific DNA methylase